MTLHGGVLFPSCCLAMGLENGMAKQRRIPLHSRRLSTCSKGISTIYADHFQALTDSRRQLTIILSLPLLGFVGVVLGLPPQMTPDEANLISLVGYILLSTIVVWFILRRANKMYGSLYGKLTDIEVKATRIERDLGDPARLLNDLAMDGLDLSAILEQPQSITISDGQATTESSEEVTSNGEEQG